MALRSCCTPMRGCSAARMRDARPDDVSGSMRVKTAVCGIPPRSVAVRAALEKTSVAVRLSDFTGPSEAGKGKAVWNGITRWSVTARKCRSLGCTPRSPKGDRGPQPPGAFWGLFRGEKSPAGGSTSRDAGLFTAPGRDFPAAQSMSCSGKASLRRMPHILSM